MQTFYIPAIPADSETVVLPEDTSRHLVQVLRMKKGASLQLTDGRGNLYLAELADDHKKNALVNIRSALAYKQPAPKISIAISPVKNAGRFEWFLEKATEIGVHAIVPLRCERTEKQHFRTDRMNKILISAMLQSQQVWLPRLHEPVPFFEGIRSDHSRKFIAHCLNDRKQSLPDAPAPTADAIIFIGPEGDFTEEEVALALQHHCAAVTLGATRLRTETAGIVALTLLKYC